jgi:hypothetical protein
VTLPRGFEISLVIRLFSDRRFSEDGRKATNARARRSVAPARLDSLANMN